MLCCRTSGTQYEKYTTTTTETEEESDAGQVQHFYILIPSLHVTHFVHYPLVALP